MTLANNSYVTVNPTLQWMIYQGHMHNKKRSKYDDNSFRSTINNNIVQFKIFLKFL